MKIYILLFLGFLAACAGHKNYNQNTTGKVAFTGGVYHKEVWDDILVFQRMSWYHGMTLYYDAIIWKADTESPFFKWFSAAEKEYFSKCESLLVTAGYAADPTKISHVNFREQMKLNGYDDVVINTFASYLKSHPAYNEWRLQNYKIMGYCKRAPTTLSTPNLAINFPGFKHLELDI